jgi:PAS domain S-box-containing protein
MKLNYRTFTISQQILFVAIGLSIVLLIFLLNFSAYHIVKTKNSIKQVVSENRSFGAVEKIDRNFYERFGDVQAFAYNRLAIETIENGRANEQAQEFMNTMVSYYVLYDLMMITDNNGKVIAVNTMDKAGDPLKTEFVIGQDFSDEDWFHACTSSTSPEGGAWYSDFQKNDIVAKINNSKGWGVAFASPIKDDNGHVIGVWYNYASWKDVTQSIRTETEELLKKQDPTAFVLITDKYNNVIDASDERLINTLKLDEAITDKSDFSFLFNDTNISLKDYVVGIGQAKGAYTYKGSSWKAFTFVLRDTFSFSLFFDEMFTLTIVTTLILVMGMVAFWYLSQNISYRINYLMGIINLVSKGEQVEVKSTNWIDEIGQITNSTKVFTEGFAKTSLFASEIGKGNLTAIFTPLGDKDVLGNSLLTMRENLQRNKLEDEKQKWMAKGLAEFGDKLRDNSKGLSHLCDGLIVFICKYVGANQAAIFLKEENGEKCLVMKSCYAWSRKKHLESKIFEGQGLVGQTWLEGEMVYLTDVPTNYIHITSGLGEANPTCILLLPLKFDMEVLGIIEIASFKKFQEYEIQFLKRLSDNMSATLASETSNQNTKRLLEQTQEQAEELKAQEEEMRQNMEELSATQEEISRRQLDNENIIAAIDSSFAVVEFEPSGVILNANQNFATLMHYSASEMKGQHHRMFVDDETKQSSDYLAFWNSLANGVEQKGKFKRINRQGEIVWINGNYTPMRDKAGEVIKIMKVAFDITAIKQKEIQDQEQIIELKNKLATTMGDDTQRVIEQLADRNSSLQHKKMGYSNPLEDSQKVEKSTSSNP